MARAKLAKAQDVNSPRYGFTAKRMRELAGIGLFALALYLALSLLTYHVTDRSWNHSAEGPPLNWGGVPGSYLADLFLQFIGIASIFIAIVPAVWGWRLVRDHTIRYIWLRAAMALLGLTFAAAFFAIIEPPIAWPVDVGLGGSIGAVVYHSLRRAFTGPGFALLALVVSVASLTAAFGLSWEEWKAIGRASWTSLMLMWKSIAFFFRRPGIEKEEEGEPDSEPRKPRRALRPEGPRRDIMVESVKQEREKKEKQPALALRPKPRTRKGAFQFPPLDLLTTPKERKKQALSETALAQNARLLESVLQDFGVNGQITKVRPGPVVTLYELEPAAGTKSSRVIGLSDDIARSMSAVSARIATIPGRNVIGIELPNSTRETVYLRELLDEGSFTDSEAKLPLALGKDIGGEAMVVDLARMPHLLVAGTTGSGKSVAINTMILSLLYRATPDECKFIMIDPKMLELSVYDNIPHLLTPVVTEPGKAIVALKWTVREMENRYRLMSNLGVRNVEGYNKAIREAVEKEKTLTRNVQTGFNPDTGAPIFEDVPLDMNPLPFIVVIVDEMADLMLVAGKDIESSIQRLAQMARAAGIHLIMATQRPSVDVITGVIKANFPTRVSFQVTSKIDSRTILGEQGAEQLLGQGDMLYMAGGGRITRVHGPFVSDKEVEQVVRHLRAQGEPTYIEDVTKEEPEAGGGGFGLEGEEGEEGALYQQALAIVLRDRKASTSYIQRCLKIGYNRAARLIDRMEQEGIVGAANHVGKREVLSR